MFSLIDVSASHYLGMTSYLVGDGRWAVSACVSYPDPSLRALNLPWKEA